MNFSEPIKIQNGQMKWSECGHLLASACGLRLTVWDAANLDVLQVFTTKEIIEFVEFSPDSNFILAANYKLGEVQLFSLDAEAEWIAKISEGLGGLSRVEWSADSKHVVTVTEFNVKISFWSLTNKSVSYIRNPKVLGRCVHYNKDASYGLVVERQGCRDLVNVLTTDDWSLVHQFELDTDDVGGVLWSPSNNSFVIWDSPLAYRLQVYSIDGRCELDFSAYQHQLGVKKVVFSESGELLAVGSFDNKIRIFSTITWTIVEELEHSATLHEGDPVTRRSVIYQEEDVPLEDLDARLALELGGVVLQQSRYSNLNERPLFLDFSKSDPKKGNIRVGVGCLQFSHCGRYLASVCDNLRTAVWVWDLNSLRLASLAVHKAPVKMLTWDRTQPRLAILTGGSALFFWTPAGCIVGRIPPVSRGTIGSITDLSWNARGKALSLHNKEAGILCRLRKPAAGNIEDDLDLEPSRDTDVSSS